MASTSDGPQRPRERALEQGVEVLRDEELVVLLLGSGAAGRSARDLAHGLLADGGLRALANTPLSVLCRRPGIGPAKASSLLAAVEIGRRLAAEPLGRGDPVRRPADVHRHFHARLRDALQEEFHVLLLDGRHRLVRASLVTRGTLTASLVHPREVFREALREAAAAVVLVHNHPSGDPSPSDEDRRLTERLVRAGELLGIPVLDHVVVAESGFASLRELGWLEASGPASASVASPRFKSPRSGSEEGEMANPADIETHIERRRSPRTPVTVRIHYATVDALFTEFTRNVNEGGLFVETDEPLELDEVVVLRFTLPGSDALIQAHGSVVRIEESGMGIEFEKLDGSAHEAIDVLVRELRNRQASE